MNRRLSWDGRPVALRYARSGADGLEVDTAGETHAVRFRWVRPGLLELTSGEHRELVHARRHGDTFWVAHRGRIEVLRLRADAPDPPETPGAPQETGPADGLLRAPTTGVVVKCPVAAGAEVARGTLVVAIEAMKMEIRVAAPCDGTVVRVAVKEGQVVAADAVLAEFAPCTRANSHTIT